MQFLAHISETKAFRANLMGFNCSLGQHLSGLEILRQIGHLVWLAGSRHKFFKIDTPKMIVTKYGLIWPSSFRGEDFCKRLLKFMKNG